MPNALPHPCAWPLCPALVARGERFCAEHAKQHQKQDNAERYDERKFYWSKPWRRLRASVLRQHPFCRCGRLATVVDHIKPIKQGGASLDSRNLQPMCEECHNQKRQGERSK